MTAAKRIPASIRTAVYLLIAGLVVMLPMAGWFARSVAMAEPGARQRMTLEFSNRPLRPARAADARGLYRT